jgi:hypothetical protein
LVTPFCYERASLCDSPLSIKQASQEQITVYCGGKEVAIHHSGAGLDKSFIHPLWTPDRRVITYDAPADHIHHRGLCVGWPDVSGADFWAEVNAPAGRRGRMARTDLKTGSLPDGSAYITESNDWVTEDGKVLVREERTWTFHVPQGNLHLVDADLTLTAKALEVVFGSDPGEPREYHGLTLRVGPFASPRYLNSSGIEGGQACKGQPAKWCAVSGTQSGKLVTAAILDHPSNDCHPTKFYIQDQGMQFVSSSPNFGQRKVLKAGEPWRLRYRVVAAGEPPDGQPWDLNALWQEFAQSPRPQ